MIRAFLVADPSIHDHLIPDSRTADLVDRFADRNLEMCPNLQHAASACQCWFFDTGTWSPAKAAHLTSGETDCLIILKKSWVQGTIEKFESTKTH